MKLIYIRYFLVHDKNTILVVCSFFEEIHFTLKKLFLVLVVILFIPVFVFSQKPKVKNDPTHDERRIHFGFSLGMNMMDYRVSLSEEAVNYHVYVGLNEIIPGINIHAIANLRLAEYIDLRALPGISFGERYMYFTDLTPSDTNSFYTHGNYKVESSYLEFPLLVKYKSKRLNNFRPYFIGGANLRYDLAVKREYDIEEQLIMVKPFDIYGEIGYGMDFYLTYFKLGIELKYSFGLTNILREEDRHGELPEDFEKYTAVINKLTSHMVILSFHFE